MVCQSLAFRTSILCQQIITAAPREKELRLFLRSLGRRQRRVKGPKPTKDCERHSRPSKGLYSMAAVAVVMMVMMVMILACLH
jgi:hypothetical protein